VVKPTIERGFDYKELRWSEADAVAASSEDPTGGPAA
jgi:hypothetical protein